MFTFVWIQAIMLIAYYFMCRIYWAVSFRSAIFMRSPIVAGKLRSIPYMVFVKFWVWDETEFLPDNVE